MACQEGMGLLLSGLCEDGDGGVVQDWTVFVRFRTRGDAASLLIFNTTAQRDDDTTIWLPPPHDAMRRVRDASDDF